MSAETLATAAASATPAAPAADPWRRLMGAIYECTLLFGVLWFTHYLFSALTRFQGERGPMLVAFQVFTVLVLALYFAGFWARGRRTVPMKTMGMQIVDQQGRLLTPGRALLRFAAALGGIVIGLGLGHEIHPALYLSLLVPYAWCFVDADRRALYDVIAGTRLVHLPVPEPPRRKRARR
ncbi:MAG: RDD family protein [Burkholderiaceae bacterium]